MDNPNATRPISNAIIAQSLLRGTAFNGDVIVARPIIVGGVRVFDYVEMRLQLSIEGVDTASENV